tara:strand:- start:219 stop:410 length:192 start_codon:yes stop_codon:yes gene_type:complete
MKYVIIFLLSTTGLEEVKLKTNGLNCGEVATAWMDVNTQYQGTGKDQGNYTKEGHLMVGYYCG